MIKRRQLTWFGHVIRWKGDLANTILHKEVQMVVEREEDLQEHGWITSNWTVLNFYQLIRTAEDRELWSSCVSKAIDMLPQLPSSSGA